MLLQSMDSGTALRRSSSTSYLSSCSSQNRLAGLPTATGEAEEELLRRLEEEILSLESPNAGGPGGRRQRTEEEERQWRQRVLAVAAFKTEGERRRRLEEDILSVIAYTGSEMGEQAAAAAGAQQHHHQPQQQRRLTQIDSVRAGPEEALTSKSAPGCVRSLSVFTREDEDAMDMIMGVNPPTLQ